MENYAMEFNKFLKRPIKPKKPITSFKMNRTLCQDVLFSLAHDVKSVNSLPFTRAFFYDFFDNTDNDINYLYVIDGVEYLHRISGTDKPLVRDRALYSFLYLDSNCTRLYASAIETNPWLDGFCSRRLRFMSERAMSIKMEIHRIVKERISYVVRHNLEDGFTPRGVWGLDYIFKWQNLNALPQQQLTEDMKLTPMSEYVSYFKED